MIEALLEKPYWVIDFLPEQVPAGSAGQFFAVEAYYLQKNRQRELRCRFARILIKLNCYDDLVVFEPDEEPGHRNPAPERLYSWIVDNEKDLRILLPEENTLFTLERRELCMAVYGAPEKLLARLERLATAEGLFLWQPPQGADNPP